MPSDEKLISVVIVTRNRTEMLARAVASVVAQDYRPIEIVVIDNASDAPIAIDAAGLPCRRHRNETVLSLSRNRNLGARLAAGEWVCFLDDDDHYLPAKLRLLAARMDGVDLCFGNTHMIGRGGVTLGVCRGTDGGSLEELMFARYMHPNSTLMRREVLQGLPFDEEMTTFEDADFSFRAFERVRVRHVDELVAVWNCDNRPDQLTRTNLPRAYKNWLILCTKHAGRIDRSPRLARFYYRKMFLLAASQGRLSTTLKFFAQWFSRGLLTRQT